MVAGGLPAMHPGIIAQELPTVEAEPRTAAPSTARRDQLWGRIAARAREQEELVSALSDGPDDAETRDIVASLMYESRGAAAGASDEPSPASNAREADDEGIPVRAELIGPSFGNFEDDSRSVPELLADLQRFADELPSV